MSYRKCIKTFKTATADNLLGVDEFAELKALRGTEGTLEARTVQAVEERLEQLDQEMADVTTAIQKQVPTYAPPEPVEPKAPPVEDVPITEEPVEAPVAAEPAAEPPTEEAPAVEEVKPEPKPEPPEDISFSKSSFVKGAFGKAKGVTRDQVERAIVQFEKDLGKANGIEIISVPTKESFMTPDNLKKYKNDQVKGFYIDRPKELGGSAIVLIESDLDSTEDIMATLRHEWIVHHGLNTFKPADKKAIINRIRASKGEQSLKKAWAHVNENYGGETQDKQAEELLAYMAEDQPSRMSKLWNDLVLMVQKALRKIGLLKGRTTKAEIIQFIEDLTARVGAGAVQQTFAEDVEVSAATKKIFKEITDTEAFKNWFSDSKVVDENGNPLVVYHGSTHDIESFSDERGNPENDLGIGFYFTNDTGDAAANYAGEGPDLTSRIEQRAEQIEAEEEIGMDDARERARKELSGAAPNIVPAYLSFQNPVVIGKENETVFEMEMEYETEPFMDEALEEVREENTEDGELLIEEEELQELASDLAREKAIENDYVDEGGTLIDLFEGIRAASYEFNEVDVEKIISDINEAAGYESIGAEQVIEVIKASEGAMYAEYGDYGQLASGELIRRSFEEAGFDGIIDNTVNDKFGTGSGRAQPMEGMDYDTAHYIAFKPNQIKSAVGNIGTYDLNDTRIMYSRRKAAKNIEQADENAPGAADAVKRWAKRNFTKEGLLNKQAFEFRLKMDAEKNFGESELSELVFDFEKDLKEAYGVKRYNKIPESELKEVNQYLRGDKGVALPEGLHRKIDHLRAYLDRLSGGMIKAMDDMLEIEKSRLSDEDLAAFEKHQAGEEGGYIPAGIEKHWNMQQTISANMGTYMTRSYQAFDDPKWKNKAMMNKDLMNRAKEFIAKNNPDLDADELTGAVRAILQSARKNGNFMSFISSGSKLGAKDVSIVTKRKDVPAVIRELLGEYTDPKVNFVRSASKMQWFLANHNFLVRLRENGLGVFLHEKPTGEFDDQIVGEASETMNPINGLYTTEDFRQGLEDAVNKFEGSDLMRNIIMMNSMIKYGKTILAPTTQFRNFMSAGMFTIMNGHFNWREAGKAFKVAKSDLFTKDKEWRKYVNHLVEIGVMHDNPFASELRDAIQDFTELDIYSNKPGQNFKKFLNFMQKSYQLGDDFWKVVGFENEMALLKKAGMTGAEAEEKAAYRIRNGYPTYSMVPRGIKKIRRWPLIGTFVSFPYEIVRTSYNQIGFLREDMQNNKPAAARRMMGMAIASGAAYAASIFSMMLMGMDSDDDEAVRAQLPPWSRNSQLVYMGYDENGMPVYLDLSYLDPYTYIKKPLTALASGNNEGIDDKFEDAAMEFLDPFIGVDIGAGALGEIIFNKKMGTGRPVYNPEDQGYDKATSIMNHVRKAVQPGIVSNMERTIKALDSYTTPSGKQYDIGDEGLAWIGFRFGTLNLPQSMAYKGYEFKDRKSNAGRILNNAAGSASKLDEQDVKDAVDRAYRARQEVYKDMIKQIQGSMKLGMEKNEVRRLLRSSKVSAIDVNHLIKGKVPPWRLSKHFMRDAMQRARLTAVSDERREELKAELIERRNLIRQLLNQRNKENR